MLKHWIDSFANSLTFCRSKSKNKPQSISRKPEPAWLTPAYLRQQRSGDRITR